MMKIEFMLFLLVTVVVSHILCDSIPQPRRHHYQHEYHRNAQERHGHPAPRNLEDGLIETALNRKQNNKYEGGDHKSFQPSKLAKSSLNNMTKEQKERLLHLLESKIKEIKKESIFIDEKSEREESPPLVVKKLASSDNEMPQNIDLDFNVNGVASIGNAAMRVNLGSGKENYIKMKASGIASLGESEISIGLVNSKLKLPGLTEMFAGIPKRGKLEIPNKIGKASLLRTQQVFSKPNIPTSNKEGKNYATIKYDQAANRGDENGFSKRIDAKNTDKNKSDKTVTAENVDNSKSWEDKANDSGISNGAETIDKKIKDNSTVRTKYLTRTDQQDETKSNLENIEKNEKSEERSIITDRKERARVDEDRSRNIGESEKPMWTADETIKIIKNKEVDSEMPNDKILNENQEDSLKETSTGPTAAAAAAAAAAACEGGGPRRSAPPPLLRSRTLPAIIAPGLTILQAQIDPRLNNDLNRSLTTSSYKVGGLKPQTPRISFSCKGDTESDALDIRRKSATSRLGSCSPRASIASTVQEVERNPDGTVVLRIPAPHVVAARAYRVSVSGASPAPLNRLARLLGQTPTRSPACQPPTESDDGTTVRRLSWERREVGTGRLPRSSSIDSMVEAVWSDAGTTPSPPPPPPALTPPSRQDRSLSLVSPSVGRRAKGQRGIAELPYGAGSLLEGCAGAGAGDVRRLAPAKPQTDKEQRHAHFNINLQALFSAVEHGHVDKVRTILESTDVDVNSVNADFVSPLDVAWLSNNRALTGLLLDNGAREGTHFRSGECLSAHLRRLAREADARLHELAGGCAGGPALPGDDAVRSGCTRSAAPAAAGTTGCAGGPGAERDKQIQHWERRSRALKRMMMGLQQGRAPLAPAPPELDVCGAHAVVVRLHGHGQAGHDHAVDAPIVTKYRVQWSSRSDFSNVCGFRETSAALTSESGGPSAGLRLTATGLTRGRRYFFRAQAGNLKGWGPFTNSTPRSVVPSVWRDVDGRMPRYGAGSAGNAGSAVSSTMASLDALGVAARAARRPPTKPGDTATDNADEQKRPTKKKTAGTIRQLFTAASKFQKNLRRGVYLACILYHEDKVLVTNEDFLPVIEVDDTYPSGVYTDFHWFMKIACCWEDVKALRQDMEKHSSSSIHFRLKLLTAAAQMQSALCIQDLGQMYHKLVRDSHGTLVVSCVQGVKAPKSVSALNARWLPLARLRRRVPALGDDNCMSELLLASVHDQIAYHQTSRVQLSRGLYLGYLKLQSCVELVRVVVPAKAPNALPHTRVRDNPHVSAEEWEFLRRQQSDSSSTNSEDTLNMRRMSITSMQQRAPTDSQQMFLDQITNAAKRLLKFMDIPTSDALTHRLYDLEVIDLNNDISFIMICPPAESACSVPGQKEILLQRGDLLSLPIQAFEMIHLQTYHNTIVNKYARLSCVLELDIALANHLHREAFSTAEVQAAKERLTKLEELQTNLNTVWKAARWLMDLIGFARDKDKGSNNAGISLKNIIQRIPTTVPTANKNSNNVMNIKQTINKSRSNTNSQVDFLQLPPRDPKMMKSSPGRGSWPGPTASGATNGGTNLLHPELSKSEQHLSIAPRDSSMSTLSGSQYLSATSGVDSDLDHYSRKGSDVSQFTHSSVASQNYLGSSNQFQTKSANSSQSVAGSRLPPSRSEDTLLITQTNADNARRKANILNTSLSATSSPLLHVKPFYGGSMVSVRTVNTTNTSDSMHSLSSESESQSCPITTSTPSKTRPKLKQLQCNPNMAPSKSMTNMKTTEFTDTGQSGIFLKPTTYLKPTLNAIQTENEEGRGESEGRGVEADDTASKSTNSNVASLEKTDSKNQEPGILQVFAAYDTGLAAGTSLKLHVTARTSAREVIDLVVKQLNVAAALKGRGGASAAYSSERLQDFCLVAVIGARERCLRDDFRPLALQNPWRKGRLYVRLRHDVLAALQHSSKQPTYI